MRPTSLLLLALIFFARMAAAADWPDYRGPWADGNVTRPGDTDPPSLPLPQRVAAT